ncbi:MAG: DUF2970 domain-containing protein [Pseudomonadales bacterium]
MVEADHNEPESDESAEAQPSLSLWQMMGSAIAAGLGVQSSRNRERDFKQGKASHFIAIGIAFTVLFVVGMVFFVRFVLTLAG